MQAFSSPFCKSNQHGTTAVIGTPCPPPPYPVTPFLIEFLPLLLTVGLNLLFPILLFVLPRFTGTYLLLNGIVDLLSDLFLYIFVLILVILLLLKNEVIDLVALLIQSLSNLLSGLFLIRGVSELIIIYHIHETDL